MESRAKESLYMAPIHAKLKTDQKAKSLYANRKKGLQGESIVLEGSISRLIWSLGEKHNCDYGKRGIVNRKGASKEKN